MKNNTLNLTKIVVCMAIVIAFLLTKGTYYADIPQAQTDLGNAMTETGDNLLKEVAAVYCNSVGYLIFAVSILTLMFSKNEKVLGFAKKSAWGSAIVYIILIILTGGDVNVISNTVNTVTSWASGKK